MLLVFHLQGFQVEVFPSAWKAAQDSWWGHVPVFTVVESTKGPTLSRALLTLVGFYFLISHTSDQMRSSWPLHITSLQVPKSLKWPGGSPSILAQNCTMKAWLWRSFWKPQLCGLCACVTAPLEGCATQPLSSHILSAARWAQIPLWEATDNFLLLARIAASLLLLFRFCFHSPLLLENENPALNV